MIGPRTFKTALAFGIVLLTYSIFGRSYDPTLACFAVLVCMEDSVKKSLKTGADRVIGSLIGCAAGYLYALWAPGSRIVQSLVITLVVALLIAAASYFARTAYISMAVITFVVIAVFYSSTSSAIAYVAERTISTLYGILVAVLINRFLFNPTTHPAMTGRDGEIYKLKGAHYVFIGGDPVLITNPLYSLSSEFEQGEKPEARTSLDIMLACAEKDGVNISVLAGFRPYKVQRDMSARKIASQDMHPALAGHSEHGAGLAYDLGSGDPATDLTAAFADTPQYRWLYANSPYYGFIVRYPDGKQAVTGFDFEPWHFRYVGVKTALVISRSGRALEEFIAPSED